MKILLMKIKIFYTQFCVLRLINYFLIIGLSFIHRSERRAYVTPDATLITTMSHELFLRKTNSSVNFMKFNIRHTLKYPLIYISFLLIIYRQIFINTN